MENASFFNLTTERLFLRELRIDDVEEIFKLRSDESVNQFIGRQSATNMADAVEYIHKIRALAENNEVIIWAMTMIGEAKLIGPILYWHIEKEKWQAELGYELLPEYQGKGLMTEALKTVIEFGFEQLKFTALLAEPNKANGKSIRLLEKLGFELTGETNGGYLIYELRFTNYDQP
jgi:ribosomal-protein-alanine N-acetyltransferase